MQSTFNQAPTASTEAPRRRIVICADDFGMRAGIDEGILELAQGGRLSAVSCLTQGPTLRQHTPALRQLPVDIGLHLNFTESLGDDQFCLPLARLITACYTRRLPADRIASTIRGQFDAFETCFGRPPDFIDGHQHVHQLPVIREQLLASIAQRYPGQGIWLRSTQAVRSSAMRQAERWKAQIIALLGARRMRRLATAAGLPMNRRLLGVYGFSASPEQYRTLFRSWLADAQGGDLLMCHPARSAHAGDPIGAQRVREFSVLSDRHFPAWIEAHGVSVCRLSRHPQRPADERLPSER
jgi:predicted glycoside hydrolase/deacetylase ChbG (UPF0249 family)